jgi:proteic killer suppression protein
VIRSFRSKALKKLAENGDASKLPVPNVARVERILAALETATAPQQMAIPGWRFHPLKGELQRYAVDASGNFRITFGFEGKDAIDVDLEDYH